MSEAQATLSMKACVVASHCVFWPRMVTSVPPATGP